MLAVPFAAGFQSLGRGHSPSMPVSSGSVLFLGLQQRTSHGPAPLQLAYVSEETGHEEIRQYRMCPLWERRVVPHAAGQGLLPPSSKMIEACGAWAVK